MSTLALLVVLLLVLVGLLLASGIAYVVHRNPAWAPPIGAALAAVTLMVTVVAVITAH
ncbi:hypothetical protein [Streptomyces sp. GESEQ-35]|uniref:hypothetical protein n=1 Tax=Streptomyces sp. GESEQ-35 TaxID=2812657 RepID=UPI001B32722B|nr:hypothetical protein [Streptomyces sp. GESEQ-35]